MFKKYILYTLLAFVIYVLSSGPYAGLVRSLGLPEFFLYPYLPLVYLGLIYPPIGAGLLWWAAFWGGIR